MLSGLNRHDVSVDSMPLTIRLLTQSHFSRMIDALRWRAARQICQAHRARERIQRDGCNKRNESDSSALTSAAANVPMQYYDHYARWALFEQSSPRRNLERRRGQTGYGARAVCDQTDVARNGLQEKVKRKGCRETRRSFEQHASFLRKWN
jgi:hypothetical protein